MTAPKERPIIFSGPMVRALLEGRKTQTRRIIKPQPWQVPYRTAGGDVDDAVFWRFGEEKEDWPTPKDCPYGETRSRLWVRETLRDMGGEWYYAADATAVRIKEGDATAAIAWAHHKDRDVCPSIYMPRWASRLTLDVAAVRVERLQQISEADAQAEGLSRASKDGGQTWKWGLADRDGLPGTDDDGMAWSDWSTDARKPFALGWDKINGKRAPWESNPWVWVLEFKRMTDPQPELPRAPHAPGGPHA